MSSNKNKELQNTHKVVLGPRQSLPAVLLAIISVVFCKPELFHTGYEIKVKDMKTFGIFFADSRVSRVCALN